MEHQSMTKDGREEKKEQREGQDVGRASWKGRSPKPSTAGINNWTTAHLLCRSPDSTHSFNMKVYNASMVVRANVAPCTRLTTACISIHLILTSLYQDVGFRERAREGYGNKLKLTSEQLKHTPCAILPPFNCKKCSDFYNIDKDGSKMCEVISRCENPDNKDEEKTKQGIKCTRVTLSGESDRIYKAGVCGKETCQWDFPPECFVDGSY
ncbi:hypothetical protein QBC37DRAFT_396858 [Rhypophila decipiens]|uniref:Uncharacterized protein n=1 Tax=Rhypophila decipiens TaxID=261697 RepID=A0AAN6YFL4_9PEZI|nr:hypothetical protein QBC37DRAFT_396858 [Rhypophila decipiens]